MFQVLGIRPGLLAKVDPKPADAPGNATPHDSPRGDPQPDEPSLDDIDAPPEPIEPEVEPVVREADGATWYTAPVPTSDSSAPVDAETPSRKRAGAKAAPAKAAPAKAAPTKPASTKTAQPEPAPAEAGRTAPATPGAETQPTPASPAAATPPAPQPRQRYGESVVREILGASFIEEQIIEPTVTPKEF
jgi:DNA polymerase-3 subunit gamma/tau